MQTQCRVRALSYLTRYIGDLILWFLVRKFDYSWAGVVGVGFAWFLVTAGCGCGFRGGCGVNVGVWVERRVFGRDYGIPDYGLGGWSGE